MRIAYPLFAHMMPVRVWVFLTCWLWAGTQVYAQEKPKTRVADLRYGVALYHYYQQDHLAALSELMVADTRDGIQGHSDNPELIAGGISLAFGMPNHAQAVFSEILNDERRPQSVRDAAWFYLGKLHYARGAWVEAEHSFAQVSDHFKPDLHAQLRALQMNIHIHKNNYGIFSVANLDDKSLGAWSPYVLYNLGAAHARSGNFNAAQDFFSALASIDKKYYKARPVEYQAVQDKAYTAMGYAYLAQKKYRDAIAEFTRVHVDGLYANPALLGYGWAAVAQQDYRQAIKPWQVLRTRSLIYPAVQESLLALPFAYEKLGAQGEALAAYQTSEALLTNEIRLIQTMRATLTDGELLTLVGSEAVPTDALESTLLSQPTESGTLTAVIADDGQNWLKLDQTSIIKTRSAYLSELFSLNVFQASVLELRDLLRLQTLMRSWQPKLQVYGDLLLQKQNGRWQAEQQLGNLRVVQQEQALRSARDQLQHDIQRMVGSRDYMALADSDARDLYRMVSRSQAAAARLKAAGQNTDDVDARLKFVNGILLWNAAQEYPARLADVQGAMETINTQLNQIQQTSAHVHDIIATSLDIQPTRVKLHSLAKEVEQQLVHIDALLQQHSAALRKQVDAQLVEHEQRLTNYLAQTHLAIARLYDAELRKHQ